MIVLTFFIAVFLKLTLATATPILSPNEILQELLRNCTHFQVSSYMPACPYGNYNDVGRPNCGNMEISINFTLQRLLHVDDANKNFAIAAQFTAHWFSPCHSFQIGDTELTLKVDETQFWTPSLIHLNSVADHAMTSQDARLFVRTRQPNLTLIRFFTQRIGVFESNCDLQFDFFPFDQQNCTVVLVLKERPDITRLKVMSNGKVDIDPDVTPESSTWQLVALSLSDSQEIVYSDNRSIAKFSLLLQRNPQFYIFNFLLPCLLFNLLSLMAFGLEITDPDRPMLTVTLLLALAVTHTDISQNIPPAPQRNLLSNYADFSMVHSSTIVLYFSVMIFAYRQSQWLRKNLKWIEIPVFIGFCFQVFAINLYLIISIKQSSYTSFFID